MNIDLLVDDVVKIGGVNTKLTALDIAEIIAGTKTYTPIALTDKWLTDLGFTTYLDEVGLGMYQQGNVYVYLSPVRFVADIYWGNELQAGVDCVHQLQNVYKALTGIMITK